MVGLVISDTNSAIMENGAPPSHWRWAIFKATENFKFNYKVEQDFSLKFCHQSTLKYQILHSFLAECYMFTPLHERENKLPSCPTQRCRFLACSFTTILVPIYVIILVNDRMYGTVRRSNDIIFDD